MLGLKGEFEISSDLRAELEAAGRHGGDVQARGWGQAGMGEMAEMQMPLPDNTAPMMAGAGPFGPVEMGGMFSVVKVRRGQKPGDYSDPGWFEQPPGTVAFEWTGALPEPARAAAEGRQSMPRSTPPAAETEVRAKKPGAHVGH